MTNECHCGYKLPRVLVQLAVDGTPPAGLRVLIQCPACGCWYDRDLKLGHASDVTAPPAAWAATNSPGGTA